MRITENVGGVEDFRISSPASIGRKTLAGGGQKGNVSHYY